MRSNWWILSTLVVFSSTVIASKHIPRISALSCTVDSNSTRVIKKTKSSRKHQTHLTGSQHNVTNTKHRNTTTTTKASNSTSKSTSGLITVVDIACGPNGATLKSTKDAGPNGAITWLDCGISKSDPSSGWTPPTILMTDLVYKDLTEFESTTFKACQPYLSIFNSVAKSTGIPPIFIAAFAMEESSCDPNSSGDDGDAFGLMQITSDKCGGAPNGDCAQPDFNVKVGAEYFASQLKAFNGNVPIAIGQYNGWYKGMSYSAATADATSGCCECQQNLDYLHQFFNGWIQGISGDSLDYFNNLASCGDN